MKSKNNILKWSIVVALSGFIFGFDTVVILGANQPIKDLWHTSPLFHGFFIMSMALWGTVLGALFGGIPTEKYGRKSVLLWIGILFALSAFGSTFATNPYIFSFFRFIGGVGIGVSSVVAPIYISEISTPKTRGRLGALYQFNIVFGILIAFLSNYFFKGVGGPNDWRWMLGVLAIPATFYTVMVFGISESPRWLIIRKNRIEEAKAIMLMIGVENPDEEVKIILSSNQHEDSVEKNHRFFSGAHKKVIYLAFMMVLQLAWTIVSMPETKGISLEELEQKMISSES